MKTLIRLIAPLSTVGRRPGCESDRDPASGRDQTDRDYTEGDKGQVWNGVLRRSVPLPLLRFLSYKFVNVGKVASAG
jgi:hypothetical protein